MVGMPDRPRGISSVKMKKDLMSESLSIPRIVTARKLCERKYQLISTDRSENITDANQGKINEIQSQLNRTKNGLKNIL